MPKLYPVKTRVFIKYLESLGFVEKRSKGSHFCFSRPNIQRPFIVKKAEKEMKGSHVLNYLEAIDKTWQDLERFMKKGKRKN